MLDKRFSRFIIFWIVLGLIFVGALLFNSFLVWLGHKLTPDLAIIICTILLISFLAWLLSK